MSASPKRIFVHIGAVAAAVFFSFSPFVGGLDVIFPALTSAAGEANLPASPMRVLLSVAIGIYSGLICLVPIGPVPRPVRVLSSCSGVLLMVLWASFGISWQLALFWGGLLTWLLRLAMQRFAPKREALVLPLVFGALVLFYENIHPLLHPTPPYWTLLLFIAAALGLWRIVLNRQGESGQREHVKEAITRLAKKQANGTLPFSFSAPVEGLIQRGTLLLSHPQKLGKPSANMVEELKDLTGELVRLGKHYGQQKKDLLLSRTVKLDESLCAYLGVSAQQEQAAPEKDTLLARTEGYEQNASGLLLKAERLPMNLQGHVRGIYDAAVAITACMKNSPLPCGEESRFLSRYLRAANCVVERYARLHSQADAHQNVDAALRRTDDVLARLQRAFEKEHVRLLRNDTVEFSAELSTLDKLMRMDGEQRECCDENGPRQ